MYNDAHAHQSQELHQGYQRQPNCMVKSKDKQIYKIKQNLTNNQFGQERLLDFQTINS
jgi:hypothetical protein